MEMKSGCFIKKIFLKEQDEKVHTQFTRFGKGDYKGRAKLSLMKTSKIKIKSSFEFANDFVILASSLGEVEFSGTILSKEELELQGKKKSGIFNYEFSGNSEKVKEIAEKAYYMLLDGDGEGIKLKMKKKLPKPGKSEGKVDDKFCSLEAGLEHWNVIKDFFFWDVPEARKARISHEYYISDIVLPENEKNPEQMRLKATRKGKLVRKILVGKDQKSSKEIELEA